MLKKIAVLAFAAAAMLPAAPAGAWEQVCMKLPLWKTWFSGNFHIVYDFHTYLGEIPGSYYEAGRRGSHRPCPRELNGSSRRPRERTHQILQHACQPDQMREHLGNLPRATPSSSTSSLTSERPSSAKPIAPIPTNGTTRQTDPTGRSTTKAPAAPRTPSANSPTNPDHSHSPQRQPRDNRHVEKNRRSGLRRRRHVARRPRRGVGASLHETPPVENLVRRQRPRCLRFPHRLGGDPRLLLSGRGTERGFAPSPCPKT